VDSNKAIAGLGNGNQMLGQCSSRNIVPLLGGCKMSSVTVFTENRVLYELSKRVKPINVVGVMLLPEYAKQLGFTIDQFQQHCFIAITSCADSFMRDSAVYFVLKDPYMAHDSTNLNSLRNRFENELGDLYKKVEYDFRYIVRD